MTIDVGRVRLVCLDIDGTLTRGVGGPPYEGAVEAVRRLGRSLPVRFVTNATSRPHRALVSALGSHGFPCEASDLYNPPITARRVLEVRGHASGILLVDDASREDFAWFAERDNGPAVVVATEAHERTIADLQPAFRRLLDGAALYTMQQNRYFRKGDALWTDLGPVAQFLAYAAQSEVESFGKPSPLVFDAIAADAGLIRDAILMVGDDVEFDVLRCAEIGVQALLVRTGKYRPSDEGRLASAGVGAIDTIADLPACLGITGAG